MAGTVSTPYPAYFYFRLNLNKTQTSQEALRSPLQARNLPQQLIRNAAEINACLSLLGGAVKRSGPSYDSPLTYNQLFSPRISWK